MGRGRLLPRFHRDHVAKLGVGDVAHRAVGTVDADHAVLLGHADDLVRGVVVSLNLEPSGGGLGDVHLTGNACNCGCIEPGTSLRLGVGCSDPYSAQLNGNQNALGPRVDVFDPANGAFHYPPSLDPFNPDLTYRRLRGQISKSSASIGSDSSSKKTEVTVEIGRPDR